MKIEGTFNLESYSISHKLLLFKHSLHFEKKEILNIHFDSIFFLQIPDSLYDPIIYEGGKEDQKYIDNQMKGTNNIWSMSKVYVIESDENTYYIGAGRMRIS